MFTLADVATAAGRSPPPGAQSVAMRAAHFDSRRIEPDMLFVALPGARVNGNDFIGQAFGNGAAAVLCSRANYNQPLARQIVTDNPQLAFERLAGKLRARSTATVIGITGSNGKTTTKEALAAALSATSATLSTDRSENASVGVPTTLSRLEPCHRYAVMEIGAQVTGEISCYCAYAKPDAGVITSIAGAHLGLFGSIEAIVKAKAELLQALPQNGPVILNADDPWTKTLGRHASGPVTTFGRSEEADIRVFGTLRTEPLGTQVQIATGDFSEVIDVPSTAGAIDLALGAAFGAALSLDVGHEDALRGLASFEAPPHRMRLETLPGSGLLIDDTYNANTSSMSVALNVLREAPVRGRQIALLGDMFELGRHGPSEHVAVGRESAFVDQLLCVGELAAGIASGARAAGLEAVEVISADVEDGDSISQAVDDAISWAKNEIVAGDAVLVKASNGMGFARLAQAVREELAD